MSPRRAKLFMFGRFGPTGSLLFPPFPPRFRSLLPFPPQPHSTYSLDRRPPGPLITQLARRRSIAATSCVVHPLKPLALKDPSTTHL
ncbi:hypothetical protein N656DRAFT_778051 [Canariomyces notabilis]|uniref:Uncharacterized protein n=1 Tax=Canariomyces notabilis TaxID=2074819 RepID=A0AAN6TGH2_9PEZI|nr:hypothetical protein N656DRAFT_778051 [Canariomyces arenarius]